MSHNLQPITETVADILRETEEEIVRDAERRRAYARRTIEQLERNRRALERLGGAGIEVHTWGRGLDGVVDLGFFPSTRGGNRRLAARVRGVRLALGCRLEQVGQDVHNAKHRQVQLSLRPVDFPDILIRFSRKLPRRGKCKIVRQRSTYYTLVCEAK